MIDDAEKKSLPVHVVACSERYKTLFKRLGRVEWAIYTAVLALIGGMWWVIEKLSDIAALLKGSLL